MAGFEANERRHGALREVRFRLEVAGQTVPGLLWCQTGTTGRGRSRSRCSNIRA